MNRSSKQRLKAICLIRRQFWMGEIDWNTALQILTSEYQMNSNDAVNFISDSTNLDAVAKVQSNLNLIPYGISLSQPSIIL